LDEIDRKLITIFASDPRIHFRELGDKLDISTQAVHRRVQDLMKSGVIKGTTAGVSIRYLSAVPIIVFGKSNTASIGSTVKRLGENELSSSVLVAGGNFIYVVGLLRSISELDAFTNFVRSTAEISDPVVGIYSSDTGLAPDFLDKGSKKKDGYEKLTPLDLRIIASLREDARKPETDIAQEVGVSAKTVSRRLERMISEGSIDLIVPMDPTRCGDIVSLVHVQLKEGVSRRAVGRRLASQLSPRLWYMRTFSNLPGFLYCVVCTDRMDDLREVVQKIEADGEVKSVVPNTWYSDHIFETWRDRLVPDIRDSKKTS
jgi:DNA-binding Lrp family transcriptional regulator